MTIKTHYAEDLKIAELTSDHLIIKTAGDGVDLLGNVYYQCFDKMIVHAENIAPEFFDLKTGMAGEILQKFSTYRMGLAIVGNFDTQNSKSLHDFIYESNKAGHTIFAESTTATLNIFSGK